MLKTQSIFFLNHTAKLYYSTDDHLITRKKKSQLDF